MMRTFLALELPENIKNEVAKVIEYFRSLVRDGIRWVAKENLHITFQFIGDTREEDIPEISEFLTEHFIDLTALKFFNPKLEIIPGRNPRIIWLSAQTDDKEIFTMSKKFKLKLKELGYTLDSKPLKFHVTLGRIKKRLPEFFIHQVLTKEISIKEFDVSEATLYKSILRPEGPRYVKLHNFLFGGK